MKLAIHQPEFMPWTGFFAKMARADAYVVLDHVQFKKRYFENRNRIVSAGGKVGWVGVPVISKGAFDQAINQVRIDNSQPWQRKLLGTIAHTYAKAPCFQPYFDELQAIVTARPFERLVDLNLELIGFFRRHLGIATPMAFSSTMALNGHKGSDLILEICRQHHARQYLCGASGKDYLVAADFQRAGVAIAWLNYRPAAYRQLGAPFVAGMSALDLLFNHGKASAAVVMAASVNKETTCTSWA